ncbi:unnamed protein product [Knipowitschia caucasica]
MDDDGASETYPEIDSVSASVLKAAGVKMTMLPSLTKEDLRDLFPGPENFLRRRHIWQLVHGDVESQKSNCPVLDTSGIDSPPNLCFLPPLTATSALQHPSILQNLNIKIVLVPLKRCGSLVQSMSYTLTQN